MISKEVAQHIWRIQLKTRKILSGTMVGDHSTANKGVGFEFDQVREYQAGDDMRFIDWKSTARSGKILTKQYFEERNHNLMLVFDVSASSFVGSGVDGKYGFMAELAAIFSLVAEYSKDNIGLTLFSDQIDLQLPIARGRAHGFKIMKSIFTCKPKGIKTDINFVLKDLSKKLRKKTLIFVISDFIDQGDYQRSLKLLQHRHDVVAVRCLDKHEQQLPNVGILPMVDPESGENVMVDTRKASKANIAINARIAKQDAMLKRCGVDILQINDRSKTVSEVVKFFRKRLMY
jgi:uncharacterized protein (DUF58 family)